MTKERVIFNYLSLNGEERLTIEEDHECLMNEIGEIPINHDCVYLVYLGFCKSGYATIPKGEVFHPTDQLFVHRDREVCEDFLSSHLLLELSTNIHLIEFENHKEAYIYCIDLYL